jgi:hypothetical protein
VVTAHELHKNRVMSGLPTVPVRFAQLHGMSDEVTPENLLLQCPILIIRPQNSIPILNCPTKKIGQAWISVFHWLMNPHAFNGLDPQE